MSEWKAKRFWNAAQVVPAGQGFTVQLDARPVRTPSKAPLDLPTEGMAQKVAEEWDAQTDAIDPGTMPFTRSANTAIDKVAKQHADVADIIAAYGDSDLLCYRAENPTELVARQQACWDPLLDWARVDHGIGLIPVAGVIHRPQDPDALKRIAAITQGFDPFELTAFHDLVSLSGSWIIGFAATQSFDTPESLWDMSRIDETWQAEQWGEDEEAMENAAGRREAFLHAARFYFLSRADA